MLISGSRIKAGKYHQGEEVSEKNNKDRIRMPMASPFNKYFIEYDLSAKKQIRGCNIKFVLFILLSCEMAGNRKDRKSTRLNSSHVAIPYAVFCLKKNRWCKQ